MSDEPELFSIMPMNSGKDYKARKVDVAQPIMASGQTHGDQGGDVVVQREPLPFDTTQITSKANRSAPKAGGPCHPLAEGAHAPAVAFSCKDSGHDSGEVSPTLRGMSDDKSHANGGGQVAVAFQPGNLARKAGAAPSENVFPTLGSETQGDQAPHVAQSMTVRRLTPVECCRLQGFPDDHNEWGINEKGERVNLSDSARYRQMGNAVTVNVAEFLGRIIARLLT